MPFAFHASKLTPTLQVFSPFTTLLTSIASAVSRLDNLEFLSDIVPRTVPYKAIKEKKPTAGSSTNGESSNIEAGQTTLDGKKPIINGTNGVGGHARTVSLDATDDGAGDDPNAQLEMEIRGAGARMSAGSVGAVVNGQRDVEMK